MVVYPLSLRSGNSVITNEGKEQINSNPKNLDSFAQECPVDHQG